MGREREIGERIEGITERERKMNERVGSPGAPTPGTRKGAWMICPGLLRSARGVAALGTS